MFYYFDKTTHRCFFTSSTPITMEGAIRIEAADTYNNYALSAITLKNGEVDIDEAENAKAVGLETAHSIAYGIDTLKNDILKLGASGDDVIDLLEKLDNLKQSVATEHKDPEPSDEVRNDDEVLDEIGDENEFSDL